MKKLISSTIFVLLTVGFVHAQYIIDPTATSGANVFNSLEEFALSLTDRTLPAGDISITFQNLVSDLDSSLTARLQPDPTGTVLTIDVLSLGANVSVAPAVKIQDFIYSTAQGAFTLVVADDALLDASGNIEQIIRNVGNFTLGAPGSSGAFTVSALAYECDRAIIVQNMSILGGINTFENIKTAIDANTLEISGGINSFLHNVGGNRPAILTKNTGGISCLISGGTNIIEFSSNTGSENPGGGLTSFGSMRITGGTNSFLNNSALGGDGAIRGCGGGIYAHNWLEITGGTNTFMNNKALGLGGGIYAVGTVNLLAMDGDLFFSGNKHLVDSETGIGIANAVYANNAVNISVAVGRTAIFKDPIISLGTAKRNFNNNHASGEGTQQGTIIFDGSSYLGLDAANRTTIYNGEINLTGGRLILTGSAVFQGTTFTIPSGAVLQIDAQSKMELSGMFRFYGYLCLEVNNDISESGQLSTYSVGGLTGDAPQICLDLTGINVPYGTWNLITIGDGVSTIADNLALYLMPDGGSDWVRFPVTYNPTTGVWDFTDDIGRDWTFSNIGTLTLVPEPTTWALLGLSGLAVVLFRKRKS